MRIKHTYIQNKKVYKIEIEEMTYEQWIELVNQYIANKKLFEENFILSSMKITIKHDSGFPTIKISKNGKLCELYQIIDFIPNLNLTVDNISSYLRNKFPHICVKDTTLSTNEHELFKYEIQSNRSGEILDNLLNELMPFIQNKYETNYRVDSYRMDKLDTSKLRFTILEEYDLNTILNIIIKFAFKNGIRHNIITAEFYPIETIRN